MSLQIQNYLNPGAYSTIIPNPTVATSSGIPVVCIVGQALQGPYTPQLFFNPTDSQTAYGTASKANPLANAIQIAFENGAPRVLGVNVQPDNSTEASLSVAISSLPVSAYMPAPPGAIDAVTLLPVNTNGAVAGTFYIQDFNPVIPDPVLNSSPQTTQSTFANAGLTSMLQYVQLLGATVVPLANTAQAQYVVYSVDASTSPVSSISQAGWNQFLNANALLNAFDGAFQSPVAARLLVPDSAQTGYNPIPGYSNYEGIIGKTVNAGSSNPVTINSSVAAYDYFINNGGILNIYALEPGTQHQLIYGLFDTNSASMSSTEGQAFGLPVQNGVFSNPFNQLPYGADGVVTDNSYTTAINLLGGQRADVIVVLNTDVGIQQALLEHVTLQSSKLYRNERIALVSGPITEIYTATIQNATALQGVPNGSQRMMYMYPTSAYRFDEILNTTVVLDGTYLAAACAGLLTSNDAAEPLTHKVLTGFRDIGVKLDNPTANSIAQYGVCIIENNPNFGIRVRDQLTCDPTSAETQEISIVRQLDFTAQTLRDLMDANIIATKITMATLGIVTALATTALQALENSDIIYGYKNVVARINPNEPREIDLTVSVRPAYPCKWVMISISVSSSLVGF